MTDLSATGTTGMTSPLRSSTASAPPLVVDLDGTLIKTDLLFESANRFVTNRLLLATASHRTLAAAVAAHPAAPAAQGLA